MPVTGAEGNTIVLCGGPLNTTNVPIGKGGSNAMVPINGKPVIGWVFEDLAAKGIRRATVVLRRENERVARFVERAYGDRIAVTTALVESDGSILRSLSAGLDHAAGPGPVRVVLGDTLIRDGFDDADDFIYAGDVEDSRRWCVVVANERGEAVRYFDKQDLPGSRHLAVAGFYRFSDRALLDRSVGEAAAAGDRELSAVLARYGRARPVAVRRARVWHDFGHVDNYVRAKRELLQSRFFNSLTIDAFLNTITKVSTDNEKLEDELAWYLDLPEELKVLSPRIIRHRRTNGSLEIVQEYYGYPTLAELFLYSGLSTDAWRVILRHVLRVQERLSAYPGQVDRGDLVEMYSRKTKARLQRLSDGDPAWAEQLARPFVVCDGARLRNVGELWPVINHRAAQLADSARPGIVHGDLCFSNILFDFNNQIMRLIDPRGRFGKRSIFGDPRYDLAKLRHSAHGLYDFIVADMFDLRDDGEGVTTEVADADQARKVGELFDCLLREAGHDIRDLQFIEGLLFLSMLPLHGDSPRRQRMMYYTGLRLLNEAV